MRLPNIVALVLSCSISVSSRAQPQWDQHKGDCEEVLLKHREAPIEKLKYCAILWEAYRDLSKVDPAKKTAAVQAFIWLFENGDSEGRFIARNALVRMGVPLPKDALQGAKKPRKKARRKRQKYRAYEAPAREQAIARRLRKRAFRFYKGHRYGRALEVLKQALSHDPRSAQILYDMACCYALTGDEENAIEYLMRLRDLGDKQHLAKLRKARLDHDFDSIRNDARFKEVTGYARVKVVNGMPPKYEEVGEDNVFVLVGILKNPKLGYDVSKGPHDKHIRRYPHIWYKPHSKIQAYILRKIVGHPRTRLVPIDWDTPWDIIVSWADEVEENKLGEPVTRYSLNPKYGGKNVDPEKRVDQALREQDQALRKPEEYARKAENAISTPERMQQKTESAVNRVQSTVKSIERVGDKAGKIFR